MDILLTVLFCIFTTIGFSETAQEPGLYIVHPGKEKAVIEKWDSSYQPPQPPPLVVSEDHFIKQLKRSTVTTNIGSRAKSSRVAPTPDSLTTEDFLLTDLAFEWRLLSTSASERGMLKYGVSAPKYDAIPALSFYVTNRRTEPISASFRAVFLDKSKSEEISTVNGYVSNLESGIKKDLPFRSQRGYKVIYNPKTNKTDYSILRKKVVTVKLYAQVIGRAEALLGEFSITPLPDNL